MRWKPDHSKDGPRYRSCFPILRPIVLDDGTRVLWERLHYRTQITREWGGMGADGCEGVTEYFDANWHRLGTVTWRS